MKKALVVLLILAVAGGLFAQNLTWTGKVLTGTRFEFGDGINVADQVSVFGDDDDVPTPLRGLIQGTYDADVWGVKLGILADVVSAAGEGAAAKPWGFADGNVKFYNAYGWLKFFDKMLDVKAGRIDDGVWGTAEWIDTGYATGYGTRLEVTPIAGLNFGAFFSYPSGGFAAETVGNFLKETAIGFAYTADAFNVSATAKLLSGEQTNGAKDDPAADMDMNLTAGVGYTGLPGFKLYVGFLGTNMLSDANVMKIGLDVYYTAINALTLHFRGGAVMQDGLQLILLKPEVIYQVNSNVSVGVDVPIELGDEAVNDNGTGFATIGANPWVKYAIGDTFVKGGYGFKSTTADFAGGTSTLAHYIKAVFGFVF